MSGGKKRKKISGSAVVGGGTDLVSHSRAMLKNILKQNNINSHMLNGSDLGDLGASCGDSMLSFYPGCSLLCRSLGSIAAGLS